MKESKLLKGILVILTVFALGAPAMAAADGKSDLKGVSVKVPYGDLDLGKSDGAKILYRRLQYASKKVCGVRGLRGNRSIREAAMAQECYRNALSEAVVRIDNDLLTELHAS